MTADRSDLDIRAAHGKPLPFAFGDKVGIVLSSPSVECQDTVGKVTGKQA